MNNNNKNSKLSMSNIPGTPPPKRVLLEEINYNKYINNKNDGLINPFNTNIENLLEFCYYLIQSIKSKNFYKKFAFSGSFAVFLYKYYLKNNYSNLEIDMNSWKPKDIDIIVDKNLNQIRKSMSEIARSEFVKREFGQNSSVTGTEQIIQYNEYFDGYKIIKIDLVPESAGKGDLEKICYLKYLINGKEYKLPVLPFNKILETKREQLEGYPSNSFNEKIRNKHDRVNKHIKNLEKMNINKFKNINCKNRNNTVNQNNRPNNSTQIISRPLNFNNNNRPNNSPQIIPRPLNFNNNNSPRQLNFNNSNNSSTGRSNEMTFNELNNSQSNRQNQQNQGSPPKKSRTTKRGLF